MLSIKTRQTYLKNLGFYKGKIDGIEGTQTKKAYKDLQKKYFVREKDIDGVYGPNTETLLRNAERIRLYVKNFKLEEFKCECGGRYCTGYPALLNKTLLKDVQKIRDKYGSTIITSGLRCQKYNNSLIGSSRTSKHLKGKAVDFYNSGTKTNDKRKSMVNYTIKLSGMTYSYCNGYAKEKIGLVYRTSYPVAPNMGNAVHINV